jgi:hypothetical protein
MLRLLWKRKIWLVAIPMLLLIPITYALNEDTEHAEMLKVYGSDAIATVFDKEAVVTSNGETTETYYYVDYSFTVRDGESYEAFDSVTFDFFDLIRIGQTTPVRYVSHDPSISQIDAAMSAENIFASKLAIGILSLISTGLFVWVIWHFSSASRAARLGVIRKTFVTGHLNTSIKNGTVTVLEWNNANGEYTKSGTITIAQMRANPIGSEITVYDDPKTGRSWWEEEL